MLFKEIVDGRTEGRTDGRRTPDIEGSQKLTEHLRSYSDHIEISM